MPHVGGKALHTEHQVAARFRFDVQPCARLQVEPRADGMAPQRLHFGILDMAIGETAFAFGLEHEAVDVSTGEALHIPRESIFAANPGFEPFDHQRGGAEGEAVHQLLARGGHDLLAPDGVGGMVRPFQRARRRGRVGGGCGHGVIHRRMVHL